MSIHIIRNSAHRILLSSEFFMARRPILDRKRHQVAHELLFFHAHGASVCEDIAAPSVIADVKQHGLARIIGEGSAYLHVDADAVMSDVLSGIAPHRVVLTLMDAGDAPQQLLTRMRDLQAQGFRFALNVIRDADPVHALLPLVDTVRVDIAGKSRGELAALCRMFQTHRKTLLAERVDTVADFNQCLAAGFHLFQGYYFAQPRLLADKRLPPSRLAIVELLGLLASDANNAAIEHCLKANAGLGLNLLRLVNTPALSPHRIDSLHQALIVLGREQLQRWLQVMLYADGSEDPDAILPLLSLAATRARLLELMARKLRPVNRAIADTAFTVGILSLAEALFGMPLADILQQVAVSDEIAAALLWRKGYYGDLLSLAEHAERGDMDAAQLRELVVLTERLGLSHHDLYALQLAAFEWSDEVARSLR